MYRYERSGVLSGLSRVRVMTLNDAHIFCTPEQIKEEFAGVMRLVEQAYRDLGITQYTLPPISARQMNARNTWRTTKCGISPRTCCAKRWIRSSLPYTEAPGEAAFYGPKLDIQLADVMGHQETYSTIQIDFHLPNQFELGYIGADGQEHQPVMIHRGVISTMERMVSYLIELYAGAFPVWLAPVQAMVLPITERQNDYARGVYQKLFDAGVRAELDDRNEKLQAKIRDAQLQKIPYMLVIGGKEAEAAPSPCVIARRATWARDRWSNSARICSRKSSRERFSRPPKPGLSRTLNLCEAVIAAGRQTRAILFGPSLPAGIFALGGAANGLPAQFFGPGRWVYRRTWWSSWPSGQ